jgi:hydroxypyruvate reductase
MTHSPDRAILERLYRAAVEAVNPGPATAAALEHDGAIMAARGQRLFILALGKAALPMAAGAASTARRHGLEITGGVIVGPAQEPSPDPALEVIAGDHPEPLAGSLAAANALGRIAQSIRPGDHAWVLLSGGATSLIGAPVEGLTQEGLRSLYAALLASGLDIAQMNRIRKRFTRWGGGKLAVALSGAAVRQLIVSDVIGDDLAAIGSGPLIGDPTTAQEIHELLAGVPGLSNLDQLRRAVTETPKPDHPAVVSVTTRIVSSNRLALEAASTVAAGLGLVPEVVPSPVMGEARLAGASVAATLRNYSQSRSTQGAARRCVIWGGETTVTLGSSPGLGGRSQELALAVAADLAGTSGISVLAAGTDGRDGPTDAAGAFVDGSTWAAIEKAGVDPMKELEAHNAYPALDAVGALFRPGLTGTNVMDIVIGLA